MTDRPRTRDAARSREAILAAAEQIFARDGFGAATLAQIGEAAGLSRQTPAYFFGSKERLYAAVLERAFTARQERLGPVAAEASRRVATRDVEGGLTLLVEAYLAFLAEHPAFVRLMGWEALSGGTGLAASTHSSTALQAGLDAVVAGLPIPEGDRDQLLLDVVALCFFPLAHADTMLARTGSTPDEEFLRARTRHVVELITCWLASYE